MSLSSGATPHNKHRLEREHMYAEQYITNHFQKAKLRASGDFWDACCPIHGDSNPSLSIDAKTGRVDCKGCGEGGWLDEFAKKANLPAPPPKGDFKPKAETKKKKKKWKPPVATYIYKDAQGRNHLKIDRTEDKQFYPRVWLGVRWSQKSGLTHPETNKQIDRVPYMLPEILAADPARWILWCEGEKDVDLASTLGFIATTSPGGSKSGGKLSDWSHFKGRSIVILPDNDEAGRGYAETVASYLMAGGAKEVRIRNLPGLEKGGDLSDWIRVQGHTSEELRTELSKATTWEGEPAPEARPEVMLSGRDHLDVSEEVIELLAGLEFYNFGGAISVLERRCGERPPRLITLKQNDLRAEMIKKIAFVRSKETKTGEWTEYPSYPPDWLAQVLAALVNKLPYVSRITEFPYVNRAGDLVMEESVQDGVLLLPCCRFDALQEVSRETVEESARWLQYHLLGDFPFEKEFHRTHALAAIFQPALAPYINCNRPMFVISATVMGTGKTRLAKTIGFLSNIDGSALIAPKPNIQHFESSVFATALQGPESFIMDNVKSDLDHDWIQALVSTKEMDYRPLSTSKSVRVSAPPLWMVTANNPSFGSETQRRSVPVRLDPKMERPWERKSTDFNIPDIEKFAQDGRLEILTHVYTMISYWIGRGRPEGARTMGSFERWAKVLGGLLEACGISGFLDNLNEAEREIDEDTLQWRSLAKHFHSVRPKEWVSASDLCGMALSQDLFMDILDAKTPQGQKVAMGALLKRNYGRVFEHFILQRERTHRGYKYRFHKRDETNKIQSDTIGKHTEGYGCVSETFSENRCPTGSCPPSPTAVRLGVRLAGSQSGQGFEEMSRTSRTDPHLLRAESDHFKVESKSIKTLGQSGKSPTSPTSPTQASENRTNVFAENRKKWNELGEGSSLTKSEWREVGLQVRIARANLALAGTEFGSNEPFRWRGPVRALAESGRWTPPGDLPPDDSLGSPPAPVATPEEPPDPEDLSDALGRLL